MMNRSWQLSVTINNGNKQIETSSLRKSMGRPGYWLILSGLASEAISQDDITTDQVPWGGVCLPGV